MGEGGLPGSKHRAVNGAALRIVTKSRESGRRPLQHSIAVAEPQRHAVVALPIAEPNARPIRHPQGLATVQGALHAQFQG